MKKLFAILLTLALALSLCACGSDDKKNTDSPATFPNAPEQPANTDAPEASEALSEEEQLKILGRYATLYVILEKENLRDHYCYTHNNDISAEDIYNELNAMDLSVIDQWDTTQLTYEFLKPYGMQYKDVAINWNYQEVLASFHKTGKVLLGAMATTYDPVGNSEEIAVLEHAYDGNSNRIGTIERTGSYSVKLQEDVITGVYMEDILGLAAGYAGIYGDDGILWLGNRVGDMNWQNAEVIYRVTREQNAEGQVVKETVTTREGGEAVITNTYENGLLVKTAADAGTSRMEWDCDITYTYEDGKVVGSTYTRYNSTGDMTWQVVTSYAYDANGHLKEAVRTNYECWNDSRYYSTEIRYTFTCDEAGNIVSETLAYGDTYDIHVGPSKVFQPAVIKTCDVVLTWGEAVVYESSN